MSSFVDTLKGILATINAWVNNEMDDAQTFLVAAAEYAAQNMSPAVIKAVVNAMTAAEQAFEKDGTLDKYSFAFSNAVASLETDGHAFIESDINFAIEAVIQHRNARSAATNE